jgi:L-threonylcarbamoyladenylate synthase
MKTVLTKSPLRAAEVIKQGGNVAFPTETVYGLGANIFESKAIEKIFLAKKRPADNPLIAHIGSFEQIKSLVSEITPIAQKLIESFFPAPLTIVLPKAEKVPLIATAGLETVGIRMPKNELAQEFLRLCQTPLVAPSANLSGRPSPTSWEAVFEDLNGRIDCILQGEVSAIGLESTVVDCTGEFPLVLRTGAVTLKDLRKIIPSTELYQMKEGEKPKSPGLKHRHYSPGAKVLLVESGKRKVEDGKNVAYIGLNYPKEEFQLMMVCKSVEEYAHSVFDFFRRCDREKIKVIYCEKVKNKGIGRALMDRLRRAAEG